MPDTRHAVFYPHSYHILDMQNAVVKNVIISLILVVLCVVLGSQAAESRTVSMGIVVAIVAGCFMLWIGPRCWGLIYLIPPLVDFLPIPGRLAAFPLALLTGLGVFAYWFVMWGMGYVKFKWRWLFSLDLLILIMFLYMVVSFVRHPVAMAALDLDTEYVGGKEYLWCILATTFYLAISSIPCTYEQLRKVLNWSVYLTLGACVLGIFLSLAGIRGGGGLSQLREAATTTRFSMFVELGMYSIYILYGMHPMAKVLFTPKLLLGTLLSFVGVLLSGWRETLMNSSFIILTLAIIKRELWCFCLIVACGYGVLLYLSAEGVVKEFPYGIQRSLTVFPGIEVTREIKSGARHSSEWRIVMWKWALDPRTKYIEDYVWGDGFGQSVDYLRREGTALMRGSTQHGDQDYFARTGTWHNGAITAVHRLGIVGLVIITLIYGYCYILVIQICMRLRGTPLYLPALFFILPYGGAPSLFYISAGTIIKFFNTYIFIAMIKLFYCVGREQGLIIPWLQQQRYVPLAIQEIEQKAGPVAANR